MSRQEDIRPVTIGVGKYKAKILYHTFITNTNSNPELRFSVQATHDPNGEEFPYATRPTPKTVYMTLTEHTLGTADTPGWVLETLRYLGFPCDDFNRLDPQSENPHSFIDQVVDLLATADTYNGRNRLRWSFLRPTKERPSASNQRLNELNKLINPGLEAPKPPIDGGEKVPF